MHERYAELESYWDLTDSAHVTRLGRLMGKWILENKLPQQEVENRLRVLHLEGGGELSGGEVHGRDDPGTYSGAVRRGTRTTTVRQLTEEQQRLTLLCQQPAKVITQLRPRTADEDAALMMILKQEIEVPGPPPFLVQSMTAGEIARFTDLFLGIEYPMYAHLAPGQWFGENLTKTAILMLIAVGQEAATLHKQEVEDFKAAMSRITLDMDTRVITVTFKGRSAAQRWAGWKMPLGGKFLQLIDYEKQREAARITHEMVRLDHYAFTAEIRRGTVTSTDLHWIVSKTLGLEVRSMEHPETDRGGINDKRWTILVKGPGCPKKMRTVALLLTGEAEILIWHHDVHISRPCPTCLSPNHQARYCREVPGQVESRRKRHTWRVSGELPSSQGTWTGGYRPLDPPTTMAQLMAILGGESVVDTTVAGSTDPDAERAQEEIGKTSPRRTKVGQTGVPVLPQEFQLHRRASDATRREVRVDEEEKAREQAGDTVHSTTVAQQRPGGGTPSEGQTREEADVLVTAPEGREAARGDNVVGETETPDYDMGDDLTSSGEGQEEGSRGRQREGRGQPQRDGGTHIGTRIILQAHGTKGTTSTTKRGDSGRKQESRKGAGVSLAETTGQRRRSTSPKRRAEDDWLDGRTSDPEDNEAVDRQEHEPSRRVRSLSPQKRARESHTGTGKAKAQQFMHQFLQQDATMEANEMPTKEARLEGGHKDARTTQMGLSVEMADEGEECQVIRVKGPTDNGETLDVWLSALGGEVTDVAANGQCGWLAFYAALFNKKEGLRAPTTEVAEKANLLKKQVMNGMIANLDTEAQLHPRELKAEAMVLGQAAAETADMHTVMGKLAEHYAAQRQRSVKSAVPMHFWVRPAHLKAMAIHAREALYVLDVRDHEHTRLQVYAYGDEELPDGALAETGTVTPMESRTALTMLAEMSINGVLPPVLVLRWQETGNHFQAVTYDERKHAAYADNLPAMAAVRNGIRCKFGAMGLDAVPYDAIKNAKAAALMLKTIRRCIKAAKEETRGVAASQANLPTGNTSVQNEEPGPAISGLPTRREVAVSDTTTTTQLRQESQGHTVPAAEAGERRDTGEGPHTPMAGRVGDSV